MNPMEFYLTGYYPYIADLQNQHFDGMCIWKDLKVLNNFLLSMKPDQANALFHSFRNQILPLPNGDKASFFRVSDMLKDHGLELSAEQETAIELIRRYCKRWQREGFHLARLELFSRREPIMEKIYREKREETIETLIKKKLIDDGVLETYRIFKQKEDGKYYADQIMDEFISQKLLWYLSLQSAKNMTYRQYCTYLQGAHDEELFKKALGLDQE